MLIIVRAGARKNFLAASDPSRARDMWGGTVLKSKNEGVLYILIGVTGYAFLPTLVKGILATGLDAIDIAIWRFLFATVAMWALIGLRNRRQGTASGGGSVPRVKMLGMGLLLGVAALAAFFGLERIPASTYVLIFYCYPVMVAVFSKLIGAPVPARFWVSLPLVLIGLALTLPDLAGVFSGATDALGILMALINALAVAVYYMASNRLMRGRSTFIESSAWTVTGALGLMVMLLALRGVQIPTGIGWFYLLALAVVSTIVPTFALMHGIQKLGAARASMVSMVEPVISLVLAFFLLGDRLLPLQVIGAVLIITSVILLQLPARRPVAPVLAETGTH
jgi:drug/metabolite transporter (DMT)-like permease